MIAFAMWSLDLHCRIFSLAALCLVHHVYHLVALGWLEAKHSIIPTLPLVRRPVEGLRETKR